MKTLSIAGGVTASLLLLLARGSAMDEREKKAALVGPRERVPSIVEIMQQAHKCRDAHILHVRNQLLKSEPDWTEVERRSKDLVRMGQYLNQNNPPRGSKESWELLTSVYVAYASMLGDAAQNKDKDAALVHQKKLGGMCITCHQVHR